MHMSPRWGLGELVAQYSINMSPHWGYMSEHHIDIPAPSEKNTLTYFDTHVALLGRCWCTEMMNPVHYGSSKIRLRFGAIKARGGRGNPAPTGNRWIFSEQ